MLATTDVDADCARRPGPSAGLVSEQRSGRQRIHRLEAAPLAEVQDWLQPYERFWRGRLKDLGALLDRMPDDDVT